MGSRWHGVWFVATDPARLARWWAEVLGYRILFETAHRVTVGPGQDEPLLSFTPAADQSGPGGGTHLGITVDDRDAELERLVNMGARPVAERPDGRLVLADPEGNEFTLVRTEGFVAEPAEAVLG